MVDLLGHGSASFAKRVLQELLPPHHPPAFGGVEGGSRGVAPRPDAVRSSPVAILCLAMTITAPAAGRELGTVRLGTRDVGQGRHPATATVIISCSHSAHSSAARPSSRPPRPAPRDGRASRAPARRRSRSPAHRNAAGRARDEGSKFPPVRMPSVPRWLCVSMPTPDAAERGRTGRSRLLARRASLGNLVLATWPVPALAGCILDSSFGRPAVFGWDLQCAIVILRAPAAAGEVAVFASCSPVRHRNNRKQPGLTGAPTPRRRGCIRLARAGIGLVEPKAPAGIEPA